jgi:hypothetical protein
VFPTLPDFRYFGDCERPDSYPHDFPPHPSERSNDSQDWEYSFVLIFISKISANANDVIKPNSEGELHGKTLLDSGNGNEHYK